MIYIAMLATGIMLIVLAVIKPRVKLKNKLKKGNGIIKSLFLNSRLNRYYEKLSNFLSLVYAGDVDCLIDRIVSVELFLGIVVALITLRILPVIIWIVALNMALYLLIYSINQKKQHDIEQQFPQFIIEMVNHLTLIPSIKNAINEVYKKLPSPLDKYIRQLVIDINSGNDTSGSLIRFGENSKSIYIKATMNVLREYEKLGGNVIDNLNEVLSLLDEEIEARIMQNRSASGSTYEMIILTLSSVLAFVANYFINPVTKELFFTTASGRSLFAITIAILFITIILCYIQIYRQKQ